MRWLALLISLLAAQRSGDGGGGECGWWRPSRPCSLWGGLWVGSGAALLQSRSPQPLLVLLHGLAAGDVEPTPLRPFLPERAVPCFDEPVLIARRFLPDNLLHVLHDDLLPLQATLSGLPEGTQVAFADHHELHGPFHELYEALAAELFLLADLEGDEEPVCLGRAWLGLSHQPNWYHYGFRQPQAPLELGVEQEAAISKALEELRAKVLNTLPPKSDLLDVGSGGTEPAKQPYGVLLSRRGNRRLLNEAAVLRWLEAETGLGFRLLSQEDASLAELITLASEARVVVGVHGSLLALAALLRPPALLVEIFPLGVPPSQYTVYGRLAALRGLAYAAVRASKGRAPSSKFLRARLPRLRAHQRAATAASSSVPPHLCCRDPHFLYRIYQDTYLRRSDLLKVLRSSLSSLPPLELHND